MKYVTVLVGVLACLTLMLGIGTAQAACVLQANGELTAQLIWNNVDPVTTDTINILRSTSTGTEKLLINIPYVSSYTDTVPVPSSQITYFYEVQAQGPGGVSTGSNEVCKTFFVGPPSPTGLTIK